MFNFLIIDYIFNFELNLYKNFYFKIIENNSFRLYRNSHTLIEAYTERLMLLIFHSLNILD